MAFPSSLVLLGPQVMTWMEERLVSEIALHGHLVPLLPACEGTVYPVVACDGSEVKRETGRGYNPTIPFKSLPQHDSFPAISHTSLSRALTL